jgi:putative Holliday junction resolvase
MPATPDKCNPETILAFDFGLKRIGVAVGQDITGSASPLGIATNGNHGPDHETIASFINEWRPSRLVVGMPSHADGSPSRIHSDVLAFMQELERYRLPIESVDERHTSVEAAAVLNSARAVGSRGRISKEMIDSAAAVFIAERYLATRT